jgi:thiol-disulfide isomerase/thioredoxin
VVRNINYLIFSTSVNPTSYINLIGSRPKLSFLNLEDPSFKPDWRGKILIIDFWFLECQSCQAKSKTFEQLSAKYKNRKDIVFLSVINGKINSKTKALQYLKNHKRGVPVLYDEDGKFEDQYDIGKLGFPVEIRINKEGRINGVIEGFYDEEVYYTESVKSINKGL